MATPQQQDGGEARSRAHAALQTNAYDVERLLPLLEAALEAQCKDGWYDAELNTAILKLYQMSPREEDKVVRLDTLVRVLLKAMMQLPEPDFALAMMLVPEALQQNESVKTLCDMADKLQTAKFPAFWELARANADLTRRAVGFEAAARRFVLRAVSLTYREINGAVMAKYLGLGSSADLASGVLDSGFALDLTSVGKSGLVVLPSNPDNHPRAAAARAGGAMGDAVKLETLSGLVVAIERNSVSRSSAAAQGELSAGVQTALARMHKQIAEVGAGDGGFGGGA